MNVRIYRLSAFSRAAALSALTLALATTAIASTDSELPVLVAQSTQPPAQPSDENSKREARPKAPQDASRCYEYRWRQVGHPGKGPWTRVRVPVRCDRQR